MQSSQSETPHKSTNPQKTGLWQLFFAFLTIGIQSFGGGSATFFLIHQACRKNEWLSEEEFLNSWALAQLSPGINLLKITVFIGYRLRGWSGVLTTMSGLLVPSAIVTVLMTSIFTLIKDDPVVKAIMRGILPATIGMALAMAVQVTSPVLKLAYREGILRLTFHLLIIAAASFAMASAKFSPVLILLLSGLITVIMMILIPIKKDSPSENEGE